MSQTGSKIKQAILAEVRKIRTKVESKQVTEEIGKQIITIIRTRTRKGFGVDKPEGSIKKLAPLKPSTIAARTANKKNLHPDTSPAKSNLTETGSMLDNLRAESKKGVVTIRGGTPKDSEKAYFAHVGSDNRKPRPFLFLSASEGEELAKRLKEFIAKILNR